jgi:uncharacterized protein YprB with RNaseH-like and TPR domain
VSVALQERLLRLRQTRAMSATPGGTAPQPLATLAPSLADRLARLRPGRAARDGATRAAELARITQGRWLAPQLLVVERRYGFDYRHGRVALRTGREWSARVAAWLGAPDCDPEALLFFDTETTGLAGGTGTLVFLAGLAWFDADSLHTRQYLLTGFAAEAALHAEIRGAAAARRCLVTYNGKSFDAPLVRARSRLVHAPDPFAGMAHVDLLHGTRRRFARSWPDCRLRTAELRALEFARIDDLPGGLVPEAFRRFMRFGDAAPLPGILEHNRNDLLTLAALLAPLGEFQLETSPRSPARGTRRRAAAAPAAAPARSG